MKLFASRDETITGISRALQQGRRRCVEIVQQCLDRIEELEPKVRAWVSVDREGSLRTAEALDAELQAGNLRGPLHGIPVGIKDIVDVAGLPTAAGSERRAKQSASQDAALVASLRDARAIILGKTVTTQYASFDPPVTRNPWDLRRTPGGSSSGSAAAVAAGMCLGAIGSQTGGSITRPASFCGVAGCKPTHGRVSVRGVMPLAPSLDHPGPIARCVGDLALLLDGIWGAKTDDGHTSASLRKAVDAKPAAPPRLARLGGLFHERAEASMRTEMERVINVLGTAGAGMTNSILPNEFDDVLRCHRIVMATEAAANHGEAFKKHHDDFLPSISALIEEGLAASAVEYIHCREHQVRLSESILACFEDVDALIVPATLGPAPDTSTTGDPALNSPWSYTGLPTVSFPTGLSPDGLPLGIQLVGLRHREPDLFRVAAWCEEAVRDAV